MSSAPTRPGGEPATDGQAEAWTGGWRRYDLVKEFVAALVVVTFLTVVLAVLFSSPDDQPVTIARWSNADPGDFLAAAVSELDRSSEIAGYGPPYTSTPDAAQKIGPICLQCIPGTRIPVDTATRFVLDPLARQAPSDPALARTCRVPLGVDVPAGSVDRRVHQGPRQGELRPWPARAAGRRGRPGSSTRPTTPVPILFISAGSYFEDQAAAKHLLGEQWGMMNETGDWPGQPWLWLYTLWYQIKPFSTSGNADALIWGIMLVLTAALIFVPFIPSLRSIPRKLPLYRLIWRDDYRQVEGRR